MANYQLLKADIDAKVYENAYREITGEKLNSVLNAMVTTLGAEYQFAGVATIDTNPGTPDAKVFYIANGKGTYEKFGGLEVTEDDVVVLYWDTAWHKEATGIASQAKLSELDQEVESIKQSSGGGLVNIKNNTPLKVWVGTEEEAEGLDTDAKATLYIIIPSKVYYTISKTLKGCTIDNEQNEVAEGGAYHATILPADGYAIQSVIVTMDGKDITSTAYSNGMITISKVVGNVAIIAEAKSISEPVMDGLGIWLDASDNMDGTYAEDSTTWISKVLCGDLGHYQVELINTRFEEKKVVFAPTDASKPCMCLGLYNPFSAGAMGAVDTGDFTVEVVVDSDFSVYNTAGDSIMFLGVNSYSARDVTFSGRWRFGLYNKTNKYMDLWCNDGTGGFATSAYSPSAGKHTLTAVRSSGVVSYYDNGVYVGKLSFTKRLISDRGAAVANQRLGLHIGQQNNTNPGSYNNGFKGCLYDVKMYARALSADEVQQNHQFNNQHYLLGL